MRFGVILLDDVAGLDVCFLIRAGPGKEMLPIIAVIDQFAVTVSPEHERFRVFHFLLAQVQIAAIMNFDDAFAHRLVLIIKALIERIMFAPLEIKFTGIDIGIELAAEVPEGPALELIELFEFTLDINHSRIDDPAFAELLRVKGVRVTPQGILVHIVIRHDLDIARFNPHLDFLTTHW
jgi:hypothetical protein